jgi:hypothetical protein
VLAAVFSASAGGAAAPPVRAPADVPILEGHFLRVEGKAARLVRIQINGVEVVRGAPQPIPVPIARVLRDGDNAMAVQFVSDPAVGLRVVVERRRTGAPSEEVARFAATPGESGATVATRSVRFRSALPKYPPLALTDVDRRAVLDLIRAHHAALHARDAARAEAGFARSAAEFDRIYPEGVRYWRLLQLAFDRRLLASPDFKMKPLRTDGLSFVQEGRLLRVSRSDGAPIVESEEVVLEQPARGPSGAQGTVKVKVGMKPRALYFARDGGQWHPAIAFGF